MIFSISYGIIFTEISSFRINTAEEYLVFPIELYLRKYQLSTSILEREI